MTSGDVATLAPMQSIMQVSQSLASTPGSPKMQMQMAAKRTITNYIEPSSSSSQLESGNAKGLDFLQMLGDAVNQAHAEDNVASRVASPTASAVRGTSCLSQSQQKIEESAFKHGDLTIDFSNLVEQYGLTQDIGSHLPFLESPDSAAGDSVGNIASSVLQGLGYSGNRGVSG